MFVDGVYQASRSALDIELLDIERIEVAYGPQSTLYGHSTFSGAIGYIGKDMTERIVEARSNGTGNYLLAEAALRVRSEPLARSPRCQ